MKRPESQVKATLRAEVEATVHLTINPTVRFAPGAIR